MRIALFVHAFFPKHFYGTETYTLDLARRLRELGHTVTVVTTHGESNVRQTENTTRYTYLDIPVISIDKSRYPNKVVRDTYQQPMMYDVLDSIVAELRPDIAHVTHLINHTATLLEVLNARAVPAIATLTDFFGFCFTNKLEAADGSLCAGPNRNRSNCLACYFKGAAEASSQSRLVHWVNRSSFRQMRLDAVRLLSSTGPFQDTWVHHTVEGLQERPEFLRKIYQSYRGLITPTRFLRESYAQNGFDEPMHNIWFGTDIDRAAKPARLPGDALRIGFIGQLAHHKGIDLLIEAFARLPRSAAELRIFGPTDDRPAYVQSLRDLASGLPVQFLGTFSPGETKAIMDTLDLLVIPSRWYENSPLVLLNALATHTPVVVSDVAGMTEFLEPDRNGVTFARSDADSLEWALRRFVDGELDTRAMSLTTGFIRTTASVAQEVQAIYEEIA
ncbi:MAG: glycosyltransferase family 4 protein [Burkholderiaceae bacterium]|jgi:glycosyltransferase involved in cell wall biosynthesis